MKRSTSFSFKRDRYKSARGGHSRLYDIHCRQCHNKILVYQKDGPGILRRLYFDRILAPEDLINLQKMSIPRISMLRCKQCSEILGISYIYTKENRKAFRLYQDAVIRQLRKLNEI